MNKMKKKQYQGFLMGMVLASAVYANVILFTSAETGPERVLVQSSVAPEYIERSIPIVAVNMDNVGTTGQVNVKLIPGENNVLVETNPFLEPDLQYSTNMAVAVAQSVSKTSAADHDFVVSYDIDSDVVGGGSAGAATALAAIAVLEDKEIQSGVAITGTISPDGRIGPVGGIVAKARAIADSGHHTFLVPEGQSKFTVMERQFGNMFETRVVRQEIDLVKEVEKYGLEIIEVSNLEEAAELMLV